MKVVIGRHVDLARLHTFSAASLIQQEQNGGPTVGKADTWTLIADDLEKAWKAATEVANQLAEAEEEK